VIDLRMNEGPLSVVCLGAQPYDVEIGCGGAMLPLAPRNGRRLSGGALTDDEDRAGEAHAALDRLIAGAKVEVFGLPEGRKSTTTVALEVGLGVGGEMRPLPALPPPNVRHGGTVFIRFRDGGWLPNSVGLVTPTRPVLPTTTTPAGPTRGLERDADGSATAT
jgi:hypothetical protein